MYVGLRCRRIRTPSSSHSCPLRDTAVLQRFQPSTFRHPLTIYPGPQRMKAWVRFGPQAAQVNELLVRSIEAAADVEFTIDEETHRCWVWRNAVALSP